MKKNLALIFSAVLVSMLVFSVFAQVSVGLKAGYWVEYAITYTGNPPPDSSPERIRVDIQSVKGTTVAMAIERVMLNGQEDSQNSTFDFENGAPYLLAVPANLNTDDVFYNKDVGYVTIDGVEDYILKGETRTVVYADLTQLIFRWDQNTGILVQVDENQSTFTEKWIVDEINLEANQTSDLNPLIIYGIIIAVVAVLVIGGYFLLRKKRVKPQ
jgi:hypothetical protein